MPASQPMATVANRPCCHGGSVAGKRVAALDHLQQRLLLAEEVLVGSLDDGDREVAQQVDRAQLHHRSPEVRRLLRERSLRGDVGVAGTHGERGDGRPLHDAIGVEAHQHPVLERRRLALGAVGHDVAPPAAGPPHGGPLRSRREASAAPTPQAAGRDLVDRRRRAEPQGGAQACASAGREVVVDGADGCLGQEHRLDGHVSPLAGTNGLPPSSGPLPPDSVVKPAAGPDAAAARRDPSPGHPTGHEARCGRYCAAMADDAGARPSITAAPNGPYLVSGSVPLYRRRPVHSEHGEPLTRQTTGGPA